MHIPTAAIRGSGDVYYYMEPLPAAEVYVVGFVLVFGFSPRGPDNLQAPLPEG